MGRDRNRNAEAESTESTETPAEAEKRTRKPVDVGTVTVGVSTREIRSNRTSKLDTNPVAVAVRDAEEGTQYEIAFEAGKSDAVVSVLRRAGGHFGRGVNIMTVDNEANVVVFKVAPRRVRKNNKPTESPSEWAGPTHEAPTE